MASESPADNAIHAFRIYWYHPDLWDEQRISVRVSTNISWGVLKKEAIKQINQVYPDLAWKPKDFVLTYIKGDSEVREETWDQAVRLNDHEEIGTAVMHEGYIRLIRGIVFEGFEDDNADEEDSDDSGFGN